MRVLEAVASSLSSCLVAANVAKLKRILLSLRRSKSQIELPKTGCDCRYGELHPVARLSSGELGAQVLQKFDSHSDGTEAAPKYHEIACTTVLELILLYFLFLNDTLQASDPVQDCINAILRTDHQSRRPER
jgi:hypothetical protein